VIKKGFENLDNVKTHWIYMLSSFKQLLQEYHPILLKMALDNLQSKLLSPTWGIWLMLTFLGFSCVVPLLNNMKNLIKLAQAQDIFVIDLVQTIKLT